MVPVSFVASKGGSTSRSKINHQTSTVTFEKQNSSIQATHLHRRVCFLFFFHHQQMRYYLYTGVWVHIHSLLVFYTAHMWGIVSPQTAIQISPQLSPDRQTSWSQLSALSTTAMWHRCHGKIYRQDVEYNKMMTIKSVKIWLPVQTTRGEVHDVTSSCAWKRGHI